MNNLPAIIAAVAGLVTAIVALIGVIKHQNGPLHQPSVGTGAGANDRTNTGGTNKALSEYLHDS